MPKWKGVNIMMEPLLDLLKDITESLTADSLSPIPGFFTLRTIARMLVMGGYEGRGRSGNLSSRQLGIVRNLLDSYFETKPAGRRRVYGRRIR
jgi:hypothetical protein